MNAIDRRITSVLRQDRWIRYSRAAETLERLEELLRLPKSDRMPNMLLVGETNNGKTAILTHFEKQHPRESRPDEDVASVPVLLIQAPATPDEGRFYNAILEQLNALLKASWNVGRRQQQAYLLMRSLGVRMLIIDEIHNILAGALTKQRIMLNAIRHIGNELHIPIVGAGTESAFRAVESDAQLGNRFIPRVLPKWTIEDPEYRPLLKAFESDFPLEEPSDLAGEDLALKVASMTGGTIGEIRALLTQAAVHAIKHGAKKITATALDACGYIPPTQRRYLRTG